MPAESTVSLFEVPSLSPAVEHLSDTLASVLLDRLSVHFYAIAFLAFSEYSLGSHLPPAELEQTDTALSFAVSVAGIPGCEFNQISYQSKLLLISSFPFPQSSRNELSSGRNERTVSTRRSLSSSPTPSSASPSSSLAPYSSFSSCTGQS